MSERSPGFEEYTPSRLEWLIVMLNSYIQYINTIPDQPAMYSFRLGGNENTITMQMRHFADLEPEWVERYADHGRKFAIGIAESYKWDSWINIQVEFDPIDRPPTQGQS